MHPSLEDNGRILALSDGTDTARFHAVWLSDNAPAKRDPSNGQRLTTLSDLPDTVRLAKARVDGDTLTCRFDTGETAAIPLAWLLSHRYDHPADQTRLPAGITTWDATLDSTALAADLATLQADQTALARWLGHVARHGFARITGLRPEPGALFDVIDLFGYVRETNYGRLFDVCAKAQAENLAYTGLGLQAHTDNPYRDPVPGLQLLACLENSAAGGESSVVDGFAAALRLEQEAPEHFDLLARHPVRFTYAGSDGVHLSATAPMIETDPNGRLTHIRFNNRSLAPLTLPFDTVEPYYAAARHLSRIVDDPAMAVTFRLQPGEAFLVDNTRVLHARTAFSGAGTRWLQGCYADLDGLRSTLAALTQETAP